MPLLARKRRLNKNLGLFGVYAIATGTTLSAGLFLLPGLAASQAGPALVVAYLLAAVPLVPATFSIVELATAMPRAGGVYYFLDRSMGPLLGTIGGLGTWLALMLKVAFALVGMGAYLGLFFPDLPVTRVAIVLAVALGLVNLFGSRASGRMQVFLVVGLLGLLAVFVGGGLPRIDPARFQGFFAAGFPALMATAGLVYISYVGVTNVASLSEEVANPERNLPLGIFLALVTAIVVYGLATLVMVGVVPMPTLAGDLTPMATAAEAFLGGWGKVALAVAALLAFTSVANAGTLSASRYPLAMSRDHLLPPIFRRLTAQRIPVAGLLSTVLVIVATLALLDPAKIAKLASAFQLLMFALLCGAVIVMRESRIESYDPGFRSPLYPWMQIFGLVAPFFLIAEMGGLVIAFSGGLLVVGAVWYVTYARRRVARSGALFHVLARLAEHRLDAGLDGELRQILKEKGLREEDPFDEVVARAPVVDLAAGEASFEALVGEVAQRLAARLPATAAELEAGFLEGTRIGATPVSKGAALPHLRLFGIDRAELVLVRSREGMHIEVTDVHGGRAPDRPIHALFFLVSPEDDPKQHLRVLAQIAERVDEDGFMRSWRAARNEQEIKEILLREERYLSLVVGRGRTAELAGRALRDLDLPPGTLVALIRRRGETLVPRGGTVLEAGDRLTVLGTPEDVRALRRRYERIEP